MAAVFPSPQADPSDLDLDAFAATLTGTLIRPDSPEYDGARRINSTLQDRHPVLIVRAADAADVARTVVFAAERAWSSPFERAATAFPVTALPTGSCSTCRQ